MMTYVKKNKNLMVQSQIGISFSYEEGNMYFSSVIDLISTDANRTDDFLCLLLFGSGS